MLQNWNRPALQSVNLFAKQVYFYKTMAANKRVNELYPKLRITSLYLLRIHANLL